MADPRLFFALWPDAAVRGKLADLQCLCPGRPTHSADLHLTLVFLGAISLERQACLRAAADAVRCQSFRLDLANIGSWPRARLCWCAPAAVSAGLSALFGQLQENLLACDIAPEDRSFSPHVTLARHSSAVAAAPLAEPLPWLVKDFVLVQSVAHQPPPKYRVLARWPLA
jgi:2'-5' RNA ligase